MKREHWWVSIVFFFTGAAYIFYGANVRVGPPAAYPNTQYTIGVAATTDPHELQSIVNGQTYSQRNRAVSGATKALIKKEYGCIGKVEIDHLIPLAIGGSNDIHSLWCEPEHVYDGKGNDWGYPTKDRLESILAMMVKSNAISPTDAQQCILRDWVACYQQYIKFGAISAPRDYDDEVDTSQ